MIHHYVTNEEITNSISKKEKENINDNKNFSSNSVIVDSPKLMSEKKIVRIDNSYFDNYREFYINIMINLFENVFKGFKIDNDLYFKNIILLESIYRFSTNFIMNVKELSYDK